jgi:DHA2 family multidrug resistance protein-like MFS transporter
VASWEWLFAVNVPIGVVTLFVAHRALPRSVGSSAPFDYVSATLNAIAFGFLILGADSVVREGLAVGGVKLAIGAVAAVLLARRELKVSEPLVPLDLLRIPIIGLSVATSIFSFGSQMLAYVALPFHFEGPMGRSAVATGLLMTPWSLGVALAAPVAGRLSDRHSAGVLGGLGLGFFSLGLFTLFRLRPAASDMDIVWRMALCGLGFGFFQSTNNRALMAAAPLHRSGAAGGLMATARMLGQTAGALGMALLFHLAGANAPVTALATASGFAGMAAVISLSRLSVAQRPGPSPEPLIGDPTHGP